RLGVAHVADGVDRHERADDDLAEPHARAADAAAHRAGDSVDLADARPGARADAALGHGARDGARGGLVPHLARGAGATVADAALLEPPHHAVDRLLAEPAAAAQDGAVDRRDEVAGVEVVEADDVVGAAAQRDAARRGAVAQDDRDAGEADRVCRVPDAESRDVSDHFNEVRAAGAIGGWPETRRGPAALHMSRFIPRRVRAAGAIAGWPETRRGPAASAKVALHSAGRGLRLTSEARSRPEATSAATSRARRARARANG